MVGKVVIHLRREHHEGLGRDEFLALGVIGLAYGAALLLHAYGFLAVFASGLALRAVERRQTGDASPGEVLDSASADKRDAVATAPETAPAHMAGAVLNFNEQLERIFEVAVVLIVSLLLSPAGLHVTQIWFIGVLFFVIRPAAVLVGLLGTRSARAERRLISWFGIRGIGSLYYLLYAVNHGLSPGLAGQLAGITLGSIAASIILHGITVTPLMDWYQRWRKRRAALA